MYYQHTMCTSYANSTSFRPSISEQESVRVSVYLPLNRIFKVLPLTISFRKASVSFVTDTSIHSQTRPLPISVFLSLYSLKRISKVLPSQERYAYLSYDGNTFEILFNEYNDKKTEIGSGRVWEWIDVSVTNETLAFLKEMVKGKTLKMRLSGKYTETRTLSYSEIEGLKDVLLAYDVHIVC